MAYSFRSDDKTVQAGLRRIALGQIEAARSELHSHHIGPHKTVHQVRKRCKKLRALVRLVRPAFSAYDKENTAFRDMARPLSAIRDKGALVEVFDRLHPLFSGAVDDGLLAAVRKGLEARKSALDVSEITDRLSDFEASLNKVARRARAWTLDAREYDAIGEGLSRNYARARRELKAARADPDGEAMHEWRKQVKYHRLHARLVKAIWPAMMHAHIDVAEGLSEQLGEHHDLFVFRQLLDEGALIGDGDAAETLRDLILARQESLAHEAFATGRFLFSETPSALKARWGGYWAAWKATG